MHSGVWAQEVEISVDNSFKGFSYNGDVAERTMRSIDCLFFFFMSKTATYFCVN